MTALFLTSPDCDYDSFYVVAKADVEEQIANAETIIDAVEKRLVIIVEE